MKPKSDYLFNVKKLADAMLIIVFQHTTYVMEDGF